MCDRRLDCWDGSDETDCSYRRTMCWPAGFLCVSGRCVGLTARCDGAWDCEHGEDEQQCGSVRGCGVEQWTCRDGGCIERAGLCDNTTDCGDGSDEWPHCHCHTLGLANCHHSAHCLPSRQFCDGKADCEDGSDELNCQDKLTTSTVTTVGQPQTTTTSYEATVERVTKTSSSSSDDSESSEKYPDYPIEMISSHREKFLDFKPLSLTKNTQKPLKTLTSEASLTTTEREGNSNEVEPAGGVRVRVYPARQTVVAGQDAVIQCRDEGELRTRVVWLRRGGSQLPVNSRQEGGRLEVWGVREEDGGDYICTSLSQGDQPGGSQTSSITVLSHTAAVP